MTLKKDFYSTIIFMLEKNTNLTKIRNKFGISKQNLNYYVGKLKKHGYIYSKGKGWYELTKKGKTFTQYDNKLAKDTCRGHAYVWKIDIPKNIIGWNKRIEILNEKKINFKLVGVSKNIPRIEIMGRKIWLCNKQIRIFDKKGMSYFGSDAKGSRNLALYELMNILGNLENKLGILFRPSNIYFQKEHYSLIRNDLARDFNNRNEKLRISDESGEWLIVDDSMGDGGELENVGKEAYKTNPLLQNWMNSHKKTGFKVTPEFILNTMNGIQQNQLMFDKNILTHLRILNRMEDRLEGIGIAVNKLTEVIRRI